MRAEDRVMLLLDNRGSPLNLAAVHVVILIRKVVVPTFTAIELVPLPSVAGSVQEIVAIPPVEDVLARASGHFSFVAVVAVAPVDDVIATPSVHFIVVAVAPVDDIIAIIAR